MAEFLRFPTRSGLTAAIWAARVALLLAGVASAAALARSSIPYSLDVLSSALPRAWASFRSWLVPSYLFATVHLIIIVIWKLSDKMQQQAPDPHLRPQDPLFRKPSAEIWTPDPSSREEEDREKSDEADRSSKEISAAPDRLKIWAADCEETTNAEENDSMDATWQAIMKAASRPQLEKSDTSEHVDRPLERSPPAVAAPVFRKSATFRESSPAAGAPEFRKSATFSEASPAASAPEFRKAAMFREATPAAGGPQFRKSATYREASPSAGNGGWRRREVLGTDHEELDQRFEAFIRMNYERMRLQRQESNQRYMEMVNGAY